MQDLNAKVLTALEVYLKRGHEALAALASRGPDEFFAVMSLREAAFQDFRALDAGAIQDGFDMQARPEVRRLWNEIDQVNRTLMGVMTEAQRALGEKLTHLRTIQGQGETHHSATPPVLRLVKSI